MKYTSLGMALVALLLVSGCVQPKPMTPEGFMGECIFPGGRDLCDNDQAVCSDYLPIITGSQASLKECTDACNKLQLQEYTQYIGEECRATIQGATDLCEQYCHRKFCGVAPVKPDTPQLLTSG